MQQASMLSSFTILHLTLMYMQSTYLQDAQSVGRPIAFASVGTSPQNGLVLDYSALALGGESDATRILANPARFCLNAPLLDT